MSTEPQAPDHSPVAPTSSNPTASTATTRLPRSSSTSSTYSSLHAYPFTNDPAFLSGLSQIFGHAGVPVTEAEIAQKPDLVLSAKCFYFNRKFQPATPADPATYKAWLISLSPETSLDTSHHISNSIHPSSTPAAAIAPTTSDTIPTTSTSSSIPHTTPSEPTSTTPPIAAATSIPSESQPPPPSPPPPPTQPQQPPYPTSFADIVDLITNNKPIPGIEEVPDTVLELGSSKQDRATRRRKPWEQDTGPAAGTETSNGFEVDTASQELGQRDEGEEEGSTETTTDQGEGLLRLLRPNAVPDGGLVAKD